MIFLSGRPLHACVPQKKKGTKSVFISVISIIAIIWAGGVTAYPDLVAIGRIIFFIDYSD